MKDYNLELLFESFADFSETLAELQGRNLEERSIQGIFLLTQKIQELGDRTQRCKEVLEVQGFDEKVEQFEGVKKVLAQLDRIIAACRGKSSYTVKDLSYLIWTWKPDFRELVEVMARSAQQQRIKAKPVDLRSRLQTLQNEVLNSACQNEIKLTLLKQLTGLEENLQSLTKTFENGEKRVESFDDRCKEIDKKLTAIATELQQQITNNK